MKYNQDYALAYCELKSEADLIKECVDTNIESYLCKNQVMVDAYDDFSKAIDTGYTSAFKKIIAPLIEKYSIDIRKDGVGITFKMKF